MGTVHFLYTIHITSTHLPFVTWLHVAARHSGKCSGSRGGCAQLNLGKGSCYHMNDVGKDSRRQRSVFARWLHEEGMQEWLCGQKTRHLDRMVVGAVGVMVAEVVQGHRNSEFGGGMCVDRQAGYSWLQFFV